MKDTFKDDCTNYTDEEILQYFDARYHWASEGGYWVGRKVWKTDAILKDWHRICNAVPRDISLAARGVQHPEEWRYSREAVAIMERMGWTGGGLGPTEEGREDPVPIERHRVPKPTGEPRAHVQFVRPKAAWIKDSPAAPAAGGKARKKEESVKGLVTGIGIRYGMPCKEGLLELVHTAKGSLRSTGEIIDNTENHREIVRWAGKVVGLAESFFPHPEEWRIEGLDVPLDKIDVRSYTQFLSLRARVAPTCLSAWEERIGALPREVGERYKARLLTPRDWGSHFKNVLHRSLLVRSITTGEPCRCCGHAREDLRHFGRCEKASSLFDDLQKQVRSRTIAGTDSLYLPCYPGVRHKTFGWTFTPLSGNNS